MLVGDAVHEIQFDVAGAVVGDIVGFTESIAVMCGGLTITPLGVCTHSRDAVTRLESLGQF